MWFLGRQFGRGRTLTSRALIIRGLLLSLPYCWALVPFGAHGFWLPMPAWIPAITAIAALAMGVNGPFGYVLAQMMVLIGIPVAAFVFAGTRAARSMNLEKSRDAKA